MAKPKSMIGYESIKKESRMNPKFLASATGWITGLLTEVRNGKKGIVGG